MLSGVLLNAALLPILRFKGIVDGTAAPGWTDHLMIAFGIMSLIVPAAFVLIQRDYKRLLAYSSIEHMGLITFASGLGPVGAVASIVHIAGHALSKSALFFGAGNILAAYRSTKFENVYGVAKTLPYTGALFLIALLGLLAVPPSPMFLSEYLLVAAAIQTHPYALAAIGIALAVIFAGFIWLLGPMLFSKKVSAQVEEGEGESWNFSHTGITLNLLALVALGICVWTPGGAEIVEKIAAVL
jgi:hydrogenase-4 component F